MTRPNGDTKRKGQRPAPLALLHRKKGLATVYPVDEAILSHNEPSRYDFSRIQSSRPKMRLLSYTESGGGDTMGAIKDPLDQPPGLALGLPKG